MFDYEKKEAKIVKASKSLVDGLLELNTRNRTVKKSHLEWLYKSIADNEFVLTGQGISVSNTGKLIDGQHRLMAIRDAGYPPVELLIVTGLDEKAMIYVDQHAKRSSADMLKIVLDKTVSTRIAAVVYYSLKIRESKHGFLFPRGKVNLEKSVSFLANHIDMIDQITEAAGAKARAGVATGFFHYALKYNMERALEFCEMFKSGERLIQDDPAYRLRDMILIKRKISYGGQAALLDYKYTVGACMADANDEKIKRLHPAESWTDLPRAYKRTLVKAA